MRLIVLFLFPFIVLAACTDSENQPDPGENMGMEEFTDTIRIASYNVGMFGNAEGQIQTRMETPNQYSRYKRLGAVIQRVRPDILVLMEFDYDSTGQSLANFNDKLLNESQAGDSALHYSYTYQIISNTGVLSGSDFDNDGDSELPEDAFGFGQFPGQYASAVLSNYPIDTSAMRSFRNFLWQDMPGAELPTNSDGSSYYSEEALDVFRLSSKNHVDLPIELPDGKSIHFLISHPTPPSFDGAEDRNGKRNHDEIRLLSDYIDDENYLVDDAGVSGGLEQDESFIIIGDLNADPQDGDSFQDAILQVLNNPRVNQEIANGIMVPSSIGGAEYNRRSGDTGDPAHDTSFFGLRVDYVLPSTDLNAIASGVFWPGESEELHEIVKDERASDHLLVWIDLSFE